MLFFFRSLAGDVLKQYYFPIFIPIGAAGNIISFMVRITFSDVGLCYKILFTAIRYFILLLPNIFMCLFFLM